MEMKLWRIRSAACDWQVPLCARIGGGWTQQGPAERMNVRQATVSKLESGAPATRLADLFDALAALGLKLAATRRGEKSDFGSMF